MAASVKDVHMWSHQIQCLQFKLLKIFKNKLITNTFHINVLHFTLIIYLSLQTTLLSVAPKTCYVDSKRSATSSQGIRGYISVMATLTFAYFFN